MHAEKHTCEIQRTYAYLNDKFLQLFSCQKLVLPDGLLAGMHGFLLKNSASLWEIFIASPPEKYSRPDEVNDKKKCD